MKTKSDITFSKLRKRGERRNHHGSYKYPHSLHNVTAKQLDEQKRGNEGEEGTEVKESEREKSR